jgi:uncharacterized pyridoxamine 5'-phosphate oxidase family protein
VEKLNYKDELAKFLKQTKDHRLMTLATCADNCPTARTMSVIILDENIYFQTGINLLKYKQIVVNNNVALCFDNVQIEGKANILGKPLEEKNIKIMEEYKKCFEQAYKSYSHLEDEILIEIKIEKITLWEYDLKGKPYRIFIETEKEETYKEYI